MRSLICPLASRFATRWIELVLFLVLPGLAASRAQGESSSVGATARIPWTTSRIIGSPEPPLPYRTERLWPNLSFDQPVEMIPYPGGGRNAVVERTGHIYLVSDAPEASEKQLFFDGAAAIPRLSATYGLAFHPRFETNRLCYLCYIFPAWEPDGTRVSEFRVTSDPEPRIDPASERLLLTWVSGGHNGGSLKFGPDGYLYISAGDGGPADPPDPAATGQDLTDFPSSLLRIDVDRRDADRPYHVPEDNPFLATPDARPEIWAYGFRNPWRMSFDRETGDLWLGDVGWQLWELVFRVEKGANYGWSVMEGPQPVRTEIPRGPTPISPPMQALPRAEAASVTGGFVYHGTRYPELQGAYIYGDYVTGKVWALRHDGPKLTGQVELTDTPYAIICFYEAPDGEIALLDYNTGTIHQLVPNEVAAAATQAFPRTLSETGLFRSTADHAVAPGVVPFEINTEQWMDHATAERFVAVPGEETINIVRSQKTFPSPSVIPADSVLVKTISLELERGNPATRRRIETQVLHYVESPHKGNAGEWLGYTYVWNDAQTDADLAPREGLSLEFDVVDPQAPGGGGRLKQSWRVSSRAECYTCHNPWSDYRLAFTEPQLKRPVSHDGVIADQIATLERLGVLKITTPDLSKANAKQKEQAAVPTTLVNPYDTSADLEQRARSWLHVNCAHCHRTGGGGTSLMLLDRQLTLDKCRCLGERPGQGTFDIAAPAILSPGDVSGSVLYYRIAKLGRGRMPHIGSQLVDEPALDLIAGWIDSLPLPAGQAHAALARDAEQLVDHYIAEAGDAAASGALLQQVFASTRAAVLLERAIDKQRVDAVRIPAIAQAAAAHASPVVRDLFERFLPDDQRVRRLGPNVNPEAILALAGNAERGRELFAKNVSVTCRNCHRSPEVGNPVGPDLAVIAKQRTRSDLIDSILDPSRKVDPQYVTYILETKEGLVHTGLLAERTPEHVVLRTAENKTINVPAADIEQLAPQQRSLMPDLLFRDLTADQLADLLAYIESLR